MTREAVARRAAELATSWPLPAEDWEQTSALIILGGPMSASDEGNLPLRLARARFERQYILYRLSANRGNLGNTARDLGIERTNLYRKMKQLGIQASGAKS